VKLQVVPPTNRRSICMLARPGSFEASIAAPAGGLPPVTESK